MIFPLVYELCRSSYTTVDRDNMASVLAPIPKEVPLRDWSQDTTKPELGDIRLGQAQRVRRALRGVIQGKKYRLPPK